MCKVCKATGSIPSTNRKGRGGHTPVFPGYSGNGSETIKVIGNYRKSKGTDWAR